MCDRRSGESPNNCCRSGVGLLRGRCESGTRWVAQVPTLLPTTTSRKTRWLRSASRSPRPSRGKGQRGAAHGSSWPAGPMRSERQQTTLRLVEEPGAFVRCSTRRRTPFSPHEDCEPRYHLRSQIALEATSARFARRAAGACGCAHNSWCHRDVLRSGDDRTRTARNPSDTPEYRATPVWPSYLRADRSSPSSTPPSPLRSPSPPPPPPTPATQTPCSVPRFRNTAPSVRTGRRGRPTTSRPGVAHA